MHSTSLVKIIEDYYAAMSQKQVDQIEKYLHSDVQFIAPLAKLQGKEAVLEATRRFVSFFNSLHVRATFGSENEAMAVYDLDCPAPVGAMSSSVLMTFKDNLITKIELFYDARPFV